MATLSATAKRPAVPAVNNVVSKSHDISLAFVTRDFSTADFSIVFGTSTASPPATMADFDHELHATTLQLDTLAVNNGTPPAVQGAIAYPASNMSAFVTGEHVFLAIVTGPVGTGGTPLDLVADLGVLQA